LIETTLYLIYYAGVLAFGIILSFAFCDILFNRKNTLISIAVFVVCGLMQLVAYLTLAEDNVWKIYPLIVHLPLILVLCLVFKKRLVTVLASVSTAYMCCQLPKWIGILFESLTGSYVIGKTLRIIVLFLVAYAAVRFFAHYISEIYSKETKSVMIFSSVPIVYYIFDYSMGVYTQLIPVHNQVATEFMPFFLCIIFFLFCTIYYKEVEQKAMAVQKENIIRLALEQQKKQVEAFKHSEQEVRILRHDLRHFLDIIALSLNENDVEGSKKIIETLRSNVEATVLQHYCDNDMVNYIISSYAARCEEYDIELDAVIELDTVSTDEILFSSILSNALDNALNAVRDLSEEKRFIRLMLKKSGGKLLLSVKNPFSQKPVIVDGIPVSNKSGHGYGTQSIRFLTEKAGGNCQFSVQDEYFILRVAI